jgi:hypothetical protein
MIDSYFVLLNRSDVGFLHFASANEGESFATAARELEKKGFLVVEISLESTTSEDVCISISSRLSKHSYRRWPAVIDYINDQLKTYSGIIFLFTNLHENSSRLVYEILENISICALHWRDKRKPLHTVFINAAPKAAIPRRVR